MYQALFFVSPRLPARQKRGTGDEARQQFDILLTKSNAFIVKRKRYFFSIECKIEFPLSSEEDNHLYNWGEPKRAPH